MKKILWISDGFNIHSGYGTQTDGILNALKKDYELYMMSFQYHGQPIKLNDIWMVPNGYDLWGNDIFEYHVKNIKPDYVVTLMDLFRPATWLKNMRKLSKQYGFKSIAYYPLDAAPTPFGTEDVFPQFDYLVAMSNFGFKVLENEQNIKSDTMIWHGVNTGIYKPLEKDMKADTVIRIPADNPCIDIDEIKRIINTYKIVHFINKP